MLFVLLFSMLTMGADDNALTESYLNSYRDIAIAEMHRSGIPASIKLAQGMLESDYGRSELANRANNHFGIKCGTNWNGQGYYREDDDYSRSGDLMKSCFRVFESAETSYVAHSDFLTDPKKAYRYGSLFKLSTRDYKSWAHGLKAAGYATDPSYPDKLIFIIEKYGLDQYDTDINVEITKEKDIANVESSNTIPPRVKLEDSNHSPSKTHEKTSSKRVDIKAVNSSRFVLPHQGETVEALAHRVGIDINEILRYNDHIDFPTEELLDGIPVFLEQKKRDYNGSVKYHIVKEGEDINTIAQLYGIRVESLRSLNKIAKSGTPLVGEKVSLRDKVKSSNRPRSERLETKAYVF